MLFGKLPQNFTWGLKGLFLEVKGWEAKVREGKGVAKKDMEEEEREGWDLEACDEKRTGRSGFVRRAC